MQRKRTSKDYKFLKLLGEGSFSSVYLATDAFVTSSLLKELDQSKDDSNQPKNNTSNNSSSESSSQQQQPSNPATNTSQKVRKYAIKVCQKAIINKEGKAAAILRERNIMSDLNEHPNKHFIRLYCTFQDSERYFFVMTYAENGELLTYMQENPLSLDSVRNYTLQLVSALEHLHKLGIIHRDLKPENILLNSKLEILITDFGSAKILRKDPNKKDGDSAASINRRNSFVGTAQYVSPEILESKPSSERSDLWALGVIIFQMITNIMPFNAPNEYLIYQKIRSLDYEFPKDFNTEARDLVGSLIKLEPMDRLGALDDVKENGYQSIRQHKFLINYTNDSLTNDPVDCAYNHTWAGDRDLANIDNIHAGLDESQLLRLLTVG